MTRRALVLVALLLATSTGCQFKSPQNDPFLVPTPTPRSNAATRTPAGTPEPGLPYVLNGLPLCQGLKALPSPLKFAWPNIETALEKLSDYDWGYYDCALPQNALTTFYRETMPKPPYLWSPMNLVEQPEGTLGVFFHEMSQSWVYIWMLSQTDKSRSYLVIAHGPPGASMSWECRAPSPPEAGSGTGPG